MRLTVIVWSLKSASSVLVATLVSLLVALLVVVVVVVVVPPTDSLAVMECKEMEDVVVYSLEVVLEVQEVVWV